MKLASHSNRVLITGIDSFTGKYLQQYLERSGYVVFGTSRSNLDITDAAQVAACVEQIQPDYVIHLAGISFVGHPVVEDFYRVNVIGTENLLKALSQYAHNVSKVILASSATVYGNQGLDVLDETLCPQAVNHYGVSKLAMELMARTYFDKLPIVLVRPFNYVGLGQPEQFVIPKIVKHFREQAASIELGNIQVEREFNSVYFAAQVYQRLLVSSVSGEVVNLCSGQGIALMSVIEQMQQIAGYNIDVRINPAFVRANELPRLVGSPQKLISIIGSLPENDLSYVLKEMYAAS
ncbi:MAG TPA: GDP-mannose 4,6-dehydratase [Thiotrichales bacterium]|nr:GDP-mannose 4,6-dehydratase [Thiotrichales bacterium]